MHLVTVTVLHGCNEELRVQYRREHCLHVDTVWLEMGRKTGKDPGKITEVNYKAKKAVGGVRKFDCRRPPLRSNEIS